MNAPPDIYRGWRVNWRKFGDHYVGMIAGGWYKATTPYECLVWNEPLAQNSLWKVEAIAP